MKIKMLLLYHLFFPALLIGYGNYYGVVTHQNKRPYQEDRFVVASNGGFFGIYDGHGGDKTSSFLQKSLHEYCATSPLIGFKLLEDAFLSAETYVLQHYTDGSTALVVYIDYKNRLYCAWVGDTRLVVEENGAVGFATTDHKPDNEKELARITAIGGKIEKWGVWRVGGLAISRSIGDAEIKKNYPGQVIAIPDCELIQLNDNNHFLIMASDGLWDVISSEEAIKIVQEQLASKKIYFADRGEGVVRNKSGIVTNVRECVAHSKGLDGVARYLQDQAIERGSSDNITVCVIYFDWSVQLSIMQQFWNWVRGEK